MRRMMMRPRFAASPPWWPAGEPWRLRHGGPILRHGRARFARRMALVFMLFMTLSVTGAITIVSLLFRGAGLAAPPHDWSSWTIVAGAFMAFCVLAFSSLMRTVG